MNKNPQSELIKKAFNEFNGKNSEVLEELYDQNIHFQDPVTEVTGLENLRKYYQHAYANVKSIQFHFSKITSCENTHTCQWNMEMTVGLLNGGKAYTVPGVSVISFSEKSQKVIEHRDYLDLGAMVYEKLPVLGKVIQTLKKRLS
jgi:hypothetical protein